jgi:Lon protease-like protein
VFGIVYYTGENLYRAGCTAAIRQVLKKFDDGRMNILVEGCDRFTLLRFVSDKPYLTGEIEWLKDGPEEDRTELEALARAARALHTEATRLTEYDPGGSLPETLTALDASFLVPATAGFRLEEKQAFLEMISASERLRKAAAALQKLIDRLKMNRDIEGIVSGNGRLNNRTV